MGMRDTERNRWVRALAVEPTGKGCRDWPWATNGKGYAFIRWEGRQTRVGHLILELSGHPRPSPEHQQLHSCDRPVCVAPWHLRWGTPAENAADKVGRGRQPRGTGNPAAKLTEADVAAIRAATGRTLRSLGEQYGVDRTVVGKIRRGKFWTHVA